MSKVLCFMDFEYTTSGNKRIDFRGDKIELLSIGAVFVDSETNEEIEQFYEVVKPKKNVILSEYCSELTKLTQEEVDNARCMKEVVDDFVMSTNKYSEIEYYIWGNFDYIALKKSMRISKYRGDFRKVVNNLRNIQPRVSRSIKYNQEVLSAEWGLQRVRLVYGMNESENKHNALSDAKDLRDVYFAFKNKAPKDKLMLQEIYEKKAMERKKVVEKGLEKHNKEINQLWEKLNKAQRYRLQSVSKSELKKLVKNVPIEYRGIESIAYHNKTISIVKVRNTKSKTVGCEISGAPLLSSTQYKYTELQVEVYPKVKKNIETNEEVPVIEVKVYNGEKKIYSMFAEVKKSTRKIIIGFIKETFLNKETSKLK